MKRQIKIVATVLAAYALCTLLWACGPEPRFHQGDMVRTKVGGYTGMVIWQYCSPANGCRYNVRLSSLEINTNTHVASPDGPITIGPTAVQEFQEFELEAAR